MQYPCVLTPRLEVHLNFQKAGFITFDSLIPLQVIYPEEMHVYAKFTYKYAHCIVSNGR